MTSTGVIDTVYVSKSRYLPDKVYRTVELFSADGVLQRKNKTLMNISASGNQMSFSMPSGYQCGTDGSYIVLSAYEREDEKQLLMRITIKPTFFELQDFN